MSEQEILRKVIELLGCEPSPEMEAGVREAIRRADEEITDVILSSGDPDNTEPNSLYFFSRHRIVRGDMSKLEPFETEGVDEFPEWLDILDADEIG